MQHPIRERQSRVPLTATAIQPSFANTHDLERALGVVLWAVLLGVLFLLGSQG